MVHYVIFFKKNNTFYYNFTFNNTNLAQKNIVKDLGVL